MDLKQGQEERGLLPWLGLGLFVRVHWNANVCPIVRGSHSAFSPWKPFSLSCLWWSSPAAPVSLEPQEILFPCMLFCPDLFFFFSFFFWSILQFDFHSFLPSSSGVSPPDYGFLVKIRNPKWTVTRIPGFLPLTSISEEMEIEIVAGASLQGLFDFPLKGMKS